MDKKTIRVTDLYLRAYLAASGIEDIDIEKESVNGRDTVVFVYVDSEEVVDTIAKFRADRFMKEYIRLYLKSKRDISDMLGR